jgi:two-component system phosphate regulon sensor histidine kinase PhoR
MSRSIYWKITVPFILLVLVGMGILGFYMVSTTSRAQINNLETQLENEARLIAEISLPAFMDPDRQSELDSIAKTYGGEILTRITIIAVDGTVLGDTDQDPLDMVNHASRPEIIAAQSAGFGQATRYSATLRENMMYVAVPVLSQGQVLGVVRVALPLTTVQSYIDSTVTTIIMVIAVVATLVVLAAALLTRMITRPVRRITRAAEGIASGDLAQDIPVHTNDEIGRLGRAFNDMSVSLKTTMTGIMEERGKLVTVLASLTDGVLMTDAEGVVMLANPAAEGLFKFLGKEVIGHPLIEAIQDYEIDNAVRKCLLTSTDQTIQLDTANGRFLRVIVVPIMAGRSKAALVLLQDLTELRNLQTMRREMVGNISHELRTPIAGIKAMVETLKDGAVNDKAVTDDFLTRIDDEVDRLTQMVSELTALSRIETGRAEFRIEAADINLLITEVVAQMNPLAEKQQISINTNLGQALPLLKIDKERIRQTLINLVHNAIKFNHSGGQINITTGVANEYANISISDTGTGISQDDLPHVFERFYKADKSRSKSGSGLGLAIAKHTIQMHGGDIRVQSTEGRGSTFSFSLPLKADSRIGSL